MIRLSIDIGTNSVLLLVADVNGTNLTVLHEEQRIPRLGEGVDTEGKLSVEAQLRVLTVLTEYKELLEREFPGTADKTVVTATSAVRYAANRSEFIRDIDRHTGWRVQLLSGDEEAQTTFFGALSVLDLVEPDTSATVLDIGGGSTEFATGTGAELSAWSSLDMGSVRFSERFLTNDPPSGSQLRAARSNVREMISTLDPSHLDSDQLIGVAGTVTSVAAIGLGLRSYDTEQLNGSRLSLADLDEMIGEFTSMTSGEIESRYPVFLKGRGDVITGGLIILSEVMNVRQSNSIIVSTGGIRHGILLSSGK